MGQVFKRRTATREVFKLSHFRRCDGFEDLGSVKAGFGIRRASQACGRDDCSSIGWRVTTAKLAAARRVSGSTKSGVREIRRAWKSFGGASKGSTERDRPLYFRGHWGVRFLCLGGDSGTVDQGVQNTTILRCNAALGALLKSAASSLAPLRPTSELARQRTSALCWVVIVASEQTKRTM